MPRGAGKCRAAVRRADPAGPGTTAVPRSVGTEQVMHSPDAQDEAELNVEASRAIL